jgi:hypothetical protein
MFSASSTSAPQVRNHSRAFLRGRRTGSGGGGLPELEVGNGGGGLNLRFIFSFNTSRALRLGDAPRMFGSST